MAEHLPERIEAKISPEPNSGCWLWTASLDRHGYGQVMMGRGNLRRAHRVVYESEHGPVPVGLDLDHLCRNRACVNPAHLEPVTRSVNLMRGATNRAALQSRTHCKNGHEYTTSNTRWYTPPGRHGRPQRICRTCAHAAVDRYMRRGAS